MDIRQLATFPQGPTLTPSCWKLSIATSADNHFVELSTFTFAASNDVRLRVSGEQVIRGESIRTCHVLYVF